MFGIVAFKKKVKRDADSFFCQSTDRLISALKRSRLVQRLEFNSPFEQFDNPVCAEVATQLCLADLSRSRLASDAEIKCYSAIVLKIKFKRQEKETRR